MKRIKTLAVITTVWFVLCFIALTIYATTHPGDKDLDKISKEIYWGFFPWVYIWMAIGIFQAVKHFKTIKEEIRKFING